MTLENEHRTMLYYLQRRHKLTQHRFNGFDVNEWSHSYNVGLNVGPLDAVWYTQFRVISVTRWLDNFFNIWPFTTIYLNLLNNIQCCQCRFKISPNPKWTLRKSTNTFNFFAKLPKFGQIWSHWLFQLLLLLFVDSIA